MKRQIIGIIAVLSLLAACGSGKAVKDAPPSGEDVPPPPVVETVVEDVFDPNKISQEEIDRVKRDVQQFMESLNRIIRAKNYSGWRNALSPEYFAEISSAAFLNAINETNVMKSNNIVLKNAQDYFNYVVVPSRANSRVDDIEIYSPTRVKAFTINLDREGQAQRWRLYDLEHTGTTWKIIN